MLALTGIGQLFLMPNKNKILQNKILSIHFFVDGFSFCTKSKIDFIPSLNDPQDFHKILNEYLDYHKMKNFDSISFISFYNPSTFVPLSLFDKSRSKAYLDLYKKPENNEIVSYDTLEKVKQVNVYSFPKFISVAIEKSKINFEFLHYNTLLYRNILNLSLSNEFDYQLFIHIQYKSLDLFLFEGGYLKFNNRFPVSNEDEFLYYLFFVVEQFDIDAKDLELIFLGKMKCFKTYYKAVNQYHANVKFIDEEKNQTTDLSIHHAPYLANEIN